MQGLLFLCHFSPLVGSKFSSTIFQDFFYERRFELLQIRDTSVLVRLRPAWEDLKNYLIAKGRKRFEVFVCTMAEKDYALEMWRLLDPGSNLIKPRELLDRIVCVKSGKA